MQFSIKKKRIESNKKLNKIKSKQKESNKINQYMKLQFSLKKRIIFHSKNKHIKEVNSKIKIEWLCMYIIYIKYKNGGEDCREEEKTFENYSCLST